MHCYSSPFRHVIIKYHLDKAVSEKEDCAHADRDCGWDTWCSTYISYWFSYTGQELLALFYPPLNLKIQPGRWFFWDDDDNNNDNNNNNNNNKCEMLMSPGEQFSFLLELSGTGRDSPTCSGSLHHNGFFQTWAFELGSSSRRAAFLTTRPTCPTQRTLPSRTLDSPLLFEQWTYKWNKGHGTQPAYLV